ncbi:MAG: sigma-70 family RNA polymerase sigma factor [Anaerolineae bacterium]|nr:sigma-70 family RNA polymerase sigma factor [Anaerolineae bacterium]
MDDKQAIHLLKNGDIGGLEFLIARHQEKAVRTAYLITQNEPLSEDIVQDSFVHFYEHIRLFDETRPFEPYFMCSVMNAALNAVKRDKRLVTITDEEDSEPIENLFDRALSVEGQLQYKQMKEAVLHQLDRLSPRQRAVIVQRYYLEMSEKEMSESLGAAVGTIKWLLNAGRNRLRILLGSERIEE